MQILDIDWQGFLEDLPAFQRLPREARRLFLEKVRPGQPITNAELGEQREVLLPSGFLVPGPMGKNASVPLHYRAFCRVLPALYRHRIFDSPSRETFQQYLAEHFTISERQTFWRLAGDYFGDWKLYGRVSSVEWLERFLAAKEASWEKKYSDGSAQRSFFAAGVLRATQELTRSLMGRTSPAPLVELRGLCPEASPALLGASLVAGMRYLLFFPSLRGDDLEPVLGIWPRITRKLFAGMLKPPATVTPHQVFHAPFLMEDIALILAACAAEPFRVRGNDSWLFARTEREIASSLGTVPDWVERGFCMEPRQRIALALSFLRGFKFVEPKGRPGQDFRLEVTEVGRGWLGLPAKERLKALLDGLGGFKKRSGLYEYEVISLLPYLVGISSQAQSDAIPAAVLASYAGSGQGTFVSLQEFLAYHGERSNPLASAAQANPHGVFLTRGSYDVMPDPEVAEKAWAGLLADFLRLRLLPLGAVKVGLHGDGAFCFALTEVGRYLVRAQPDFDFDQAPARIVVQPNFDVVFLAPAPRAESEIARFAERKGRHMGTLFKITKRSILAAAAAGLTPNHVFETLRQCCSGELPPNVQREISGWFAQCRRISLRRAVLIHCQDADTAARVLAAAGKKAARITDTTLELQDTKAQPALLRKLREIGIFLRP